MVRSDGQSEDTMAIMRGKIVIQVWHTQLEGRQLYRLHSLALQ